MDQEQATASTSEQKLAELDAARQALESLLLALHPVIVSAHAPEDGPRNHWPYVAAALMFTSWVLGSLAFTIHDHGDALGALSQIPMGVLVLLAILFFVASIPVATMDVPRPARDKTAESDAIDAAALECEQRDPAGFLYRFVTFYPEGSEEAAELCEFVHVRRLERGWGRRYAKAAINLLGHIERMRHQVYESITRDFARQHGIPKPFTPPADPLPTA